MNVKHTRAWNDFPFAPRRFPVFYGWVMAAGAVMAVLASIPGQTMGVGVFTEWWVEAWGLDRLQLSAAYMCGTIASSFIMPWAGVLLDRHGSRVMVVVASVGLGLSLVAIVLAERIMPDTSATAGLVLAFCLIVVLFLSLRFFGQGCLALCSRVVIGKWFNRYRGRATAIAGAFTAFGFSASPIGLNWLVGTFGWREACLILAATIGLGVAFTGWLIYRDNPEACGLEMDGAAPPKEGDLVQGAALLETRHEFTRREALGTVSFWAFSLGLSAHGLIMTAVTFHIAALGREAGLAPSEAFAVFWPMAFFSVATNIGGGILADRTKLKYLLAAMMCAEIVGCFGILHMSETYGRACMVAGYGAAGGFFANLVTVTWPRFFGRRHLGAVSGVNMSVMVFGSALGPVFFALGESFSGSFRGVMSLWMLVPASILLLSFRANNPQETWPKD